MEPEVLEHGPHPALFAKENGLYFYKEIITKCSQHLFNGGMIFFEIGINQEADIVQMLENYSFSDIKVIPDLNKIPRHKLIKPGNIYWNAGSLHIYERHFKYLEELINK